MIKILIDVMVFGAVSGLLLALLSVILGPLWKNDESTKPVDPGCKFCHSPGKLHKGICTECWMMVIQGLERCDDCGRLWEPAGDDSRDICPRCRVLKVGIVPPADMTETDKMRLRWAPANHREN